MKITVEFESLAEFEEHFISSESIKNKAIECKIDSATKDLSEQIQAVNGHIQTLHSKKPLSTR
jgi:hypothetical protein